MKDIGAIGQEWWLGMQINSWLDTNNAIYFDTLEKIASVLYLNICDSECEQS